MRIKIYIEVKIMENKEFKKALNELIVDKETQKITPIGMYILVFATLSILTYLIKTKKH